MTFFGWTTKLKKGRKGMGTPPRIDIICFTVVQYLFFYKSISFIEGGSFSQRGCFRHKNSGVVLFRFGYPQSKFTQKKEKKVIDETLQVVLSLSKKFLCFSLFRLGLMSYSFLFVKPYRLDTTPDLCKLGPLPTLRSLRSHYRGTMEDTDGTR